MVGCEWLMRDSCGCSNGHCKTLCLLLICHKMMKTGAKRNISVSLVYRLLQRETHPAFDHERVRKDVIKDAHYLN